MKVILGLSNKLGSVKSTSRNNTGIYNFKYQT